MEFSADPKQDLKSESDLTRFEIPIGILAIVMYVLERVLAFAWLQSRSVSGAGWETEFLGFFFGQAPYSFFNILLGFDVPETFIGMLNPGNILRALLQVVHFLINIFLAGLPFRLLLLLEKQRAEQE
jgi:hypothetical protein